MKAEYAWADQCMREFGYQRRRNITGRLVRKDGSVHEDGWPTQSCIATMRDGGITGGSGVMRQHFPEVYTGEALEVWRVWQILEIHCKEYLHMHYVVHLDEHGQEMRAAQKAEVMGVSRKQYFIEVGAALCGVANALRVRQTLQVSQSA